jgi:dTDP-4-dehydrorhamnose reductase
MNYRVLVTGAGGFLGAHLLDSAPEHIEPVAWLNRTRTFFPVIVVEGDLADPPMREYTLEEAEPQAIIHLAAVADAAACEKDPRGSHAINVEATDAIARFAAARNLPFILASTDMVFDGRQAPYKPSDNPSPLMTYGRQKAEAEVAVRQANPDAIIARLPLMYGETVRPGRGMVQGMLDALKAGKRPRLFVDEFRSAGHARRIAEGLWHFLLAHRDGDSRAGTWHFGGPERISRLEFGQAVARVWELDPGLLQASYQKDVKTGSARPADVSMDSSATFKAGFQHGSLLEELALIRDNGVS